MCREQLQKGCLISKNKIKQLKLSYGQLVSVFFHLLLQKVKPRVKDFLTSFYWKKHILTSSAFFINLYNLLTCYTGSTLGTQHVGKLSLEKQAVLRQVNIKQLLSGFVVLQLLHSQEKLGIFHIVIKSSPQKLYCNGLTKS